MLGRFGKIFLGRDGHSLGFQVDFIKQILGQVALKHILIAFINLYEI